MDFNSSPLYIVAPQTRARRFPEATRVKVAAAGPDAAPVEVPAGSWIAVEAGGTPRVLDDAAFRRNYLHVPPDPKSFVVRREPVRAGLEFGVVRIEGSAEAMLPADFARLAVRIDDVGRPICRVCDPLWRQAELLLSRGAAAARHLDAIRKLAGVATGEVQDLATWTDLNMLDVVLAAERDEISDGMAGVNAMRPAEGIVGTVEVDGEQVAVIDRASLRASAAIALGLPPLALVDIVRTPTYDSGAMRATARHWLSPYLGTARMEDALVLMLPAGEAGDLLRDGVEARLARAELLRTGPPARIEGLAGYETSPWRRYRLSEGVEAVAFEDMAGFYVYVWRDPDWRPEAAPGEDDTPSPGLH